MSHSDVPRRFEQRPPRRPGGLSVTLPCRMLLPDLVDLRVRLGYRAADPYAVSVDLMRGPVPVRWYVSREAMAAGLDTSCGLGDVVLQPGVRRQGCPTVEIVLRPGRAVAVFEVALAPVERWLARTHQLVPLGAEAEHIDWDATLTHLLGARDAR